MRSGRNWTQDELNTLQDLWGTKTIPQIAKVLGRSNDAVKVKSTRLGLGHFKENSEYLCAQDIMKILKVDTHTVTDYWIPKCGLKYKIVRPLGKKAFKYIKHSDLLDWLEQNQDKWDSRKVEEYGLGIEPVWLKEKRKKDRSKPKKFKPYTKEEDSVICALYRKGVKIQEIADRVGRSYAAIDHRVARLDIWGSGRRIPDKELQATKEAKARKEAQLEFLKILRIRLNQLNFDGYWQKEMCMLWDDVKGCTAGESDCDSCVNFQRIQPQYCKRCGNTFFERKPELICKRCREQRTKQYLRKKAALAGGK